MIVAHLSNPKTFKRVHLFLQSLSIKVILIIYVTAGCEVSFLRVNVESIASSIELQIKTFFISAITCPPHTFFLKNVLKLGSEVAFIVTVFG